MKVVLATAFPRNADQPRGGVEAVNVVLAPALATESGFDVHIVTTDDTVEAVERATCGPLTVHRLPWRARRMLTGSLGSAGRAVREYVRSLSPDVVHAHDTFGIMLADLDVPRVLTIHGFIHGDTLVSGERFARLRSRLWRRIETSAWARYPRIISISPYVRERLSGKVRGTIHDIDNPVAADFFSITRRPGRPAVFCAASISPRKNIVGLVEAFASLTSRGVDAVLRIAGPCSMPSYAQQVRDRIRAHGLDDRVTVLPSIDRQEVCDELARASVAALVSLEENSPLTVQEAMAAGVPVVTSNRCGMPYQVTDGDTGFLVDPENPVEIADRLQQLIASDECRNSMGARAHVAARARFHPTAVARRTLAVYRALAGRAAAETPAPQSL